MTEKTEVETTIFINFMDIFGMENMIELQINQATLETLFDKNDVIISPVYIQASTPHQARLALADALVMTATRLGVTRVGDLARQELIRQAEEQ